MRQEGSSPTMKDVAREAGVSLGTVSKVINGISVGEAYREKVEAAAKKLGYQVNSYARGLKTNRTNTIALILPTLRHPFFAWLAEEAYACLMKRNYRTVLMITEYDSLVEQRCISLVRAHKIDGVIALSYNPDLEIDPGLPFATIDRHLNSDVPCISSDNFEGGRMAACKLVELGCRRLLYLSIGSKLYSEVNRRGAGFENYCRKEGISFESVELDENEKDDPFYNFLLEHITDGRLDFDGIFCNTDHLAVRIINFLKKQSIRIPEDVQIIGYDGLVDFGTGRHYCSTMVQPVRQIVEAAADILLGEAHDAGQKNINLPVSYEAGGTTKD